MADDGKNGGPMSAQRGQIVLITLLILTIATTIALSLLSRTTTDTAISKQVEDAARAFSAAEAGIEEALKAGVSKSGIYELSPGLTYTVNVAFISGTADLYAFPKKTLKGHTETLWLAAHNADGTLDENTTYQSPSLDLCWSSETPVPALVVAILYKESSDGSYRVLRGAYDADVVRAGTNKFAAPTFGVGGCGANTGTTYKQTITFNALNPTVDPTVDKLLAMRIRPVYSDTQIVADPVAALPYQGNRIESVGATANGVNRKIIVHQQYRSASTIFDSAIYSQASFSHQ